MTEQWKKIQGFNGYSVSNLGRVKSLKRDTERTNRFGTTHKKKVSERVLKSGRHPNGYLHVTLRKNNKAHTKRVHQLVALAFLGKKPKGMVIHHIDGNKLNNKLKNLEYTTKSRNTHLWHVSNGSSKGTVTIQDILQIKKRIAIGEEMGEIAREYNLTRNDVACIYRVIKLD